MRTLRLLAATTIATAATLLISATTAQASQPERSRPVLGKYRELY